MKKLKCLAISFILISCVNAQNTAQYKWGPRPPLVKECNEKGEVSDGGLIPMLPHTYFSIISKKNADTLIATAGLAAKIIDNKVIIDEPEKFRQLNLKTDRSGSFSTLQQVKTMTADDVYQNRKYFLVPVAILGTLDAVPVYQTGGKSHELTIGASTLPFKLRLHNFDFAKDLNIGSVIGISRRTHETKNRFINYLLNVSISVNDLDELSTRNVPADQLPAKNIAALTLAGGVVWQWGKGQVGVFYGFDFMSHNNWTKYRWVYNKRPWIGIGFGINLFQKEDLSSGPADQISNYKKKQKNKKAKKSIS